MAPTSPFLFPLVSLQFSALLFKTVQKLKAAVAKEIRKDKRLKMPCCAFVTRKRNLLVAKLV